MAHDSERAIDPQPTIASSGFTTKEDIKGVVSAMDACYLKIKVEERLNR